MRPVPALLLTLLALAGPARALLGAVPASAAVRAPADSAALADPARLERWRQDLHTLGVELPRRHGDLYWRTSEPVFRATLDSLERALPESPDWLVTAGIARLMALADAHTTLQWGDSAAHFHRLPFQFARFADGWRVVVTDSASTALLGARLVSVGGVVVDRAAAALAPFLSHENDAWLGDRLSLAFACPELIAAAGLAPAPDRVRLVFARDGADSLSEVAAAPLDGGPARRGVSIVDAGLAPLTLARREPGRAYWFALLPESRALLFRYNACVEIDTLPFARFAAALWAAADSAGVERVVVDLRANGGGNSTVWDPFVRGLMARPALARRDRLAVLIGPRTYSSAVLDAWELRDHATYYGLPTGGRPNGWGEIKSFRLPASRLPIQYSTRYFRLVRDADPPSWMPDVMVPLEWPDVRIGRDAALEAALGGFASPAR